MSIPFHGNHCCDLVFSSYLLVKSGLFIGERVLSRSSALFVLLLALLDPSCLVLLAGARRRGGGEKEGEKGEKGEKEITQALSTGESTRYPRSAGEEETEGARPPGREQPKQDMYIARLHYYHPTHTQQSIKTLRMNNVLLLIFPEFFRQQYRQRQYLLTNASISLQAPLRHVLLPLPYKRDFRVAGAPKGRRRSFLVKIKK